MVWRGWGIPVLLLGLSAAGWGAPVKPVRFVSGRMVGELTQAAGQVSVRSASAASRTVTRFALLHDGDMVALGAASSARVSLGRGGTCYTLAAASRVRVVKDHLLLLAGPNPQVSVKAAADVLPAALFDRERETVISRGPGQWGPKEPSPLFGVRGPGVLLRWEGPINPDDAPPGEGTLRVRVKETGAVRWAFSQNLPQDAHSVQVPAGLLEPGRWYTWSVQVIGPGDLPSAGGPLRLLTAAEEEELDQVESEVKTGHSSSRAAESDETLAEAYLSYGLLAEARQAYEEARRAGGGLECTRAIGSLTGLLAGAESPQPK